VRGGGSAFAATTEPVELAFSDGSSVELAQAARGRILSLKPQGAEVRLQSGRAKVHVNPQTGAHWRFHAGSLVVDVTGTRFDLGWSPETGRATLAMVEGSVLLSGCGIETSRKVRAPETVELYCAGDTGPLPPAPARVAPAAPTLAPANEPAAEREVEAPRAGPASWQALARSGKYKEAHASAEALGIEQQLSAGTGGDLLLLGDVSRYAGYVADAVTAYKTARRRFPGTDSAAQAAFALGRLAFDQQRAYAEAASHFETYLRERPRGSFAPEARGRRIDALQRSGNRAAARSAAQEYLRLYASGPYAAQARKLLEAR
jgi:ferric-dicitrate binding protein FerR (iron transport regulator)